VEHEGVDADEPTPGVPSAAAAGPVPAAANVVFGPSLALAERFVGHLATTGIAWGLVGPREVPRLWDRHVLNCAVMTELLEDGARVLDIGSGAGLPGLTLALRRPDLTVVLVEPLLRRATWLEQVVADLGLSTVSVRRARAEELHGVEQADYVTARAVASLDRLAQWGLPLLRPHGQLLALKGRSAEEEISRTEAAVTAAGGIGTDVVTVGAGVIDSPVTVVRVRVGARRPAPRTQAGGRRRSTRGSAESAPHTETGTTADQAAGSARRRGGPRPGRRPPAH
jgi:16S rRNA (guanine527-N7)-methyltransferase